MGNFDEDGEPGVLMRERMDLNGQSKADKARTGLEMMHRRARRVDPGTALHILKHVVPDIPPDEEDQK